ncbi:hypothetical protein XENOCAPTIV_006119 [Xenoophorus captivus]|uniref:Glycoprotein n=1 Tax=Xenoophorus captivus TaxID=1517983 RepID=A0ABV0QUV5_9TELE
MFIQLINYLFETNSWYQYAKIVSKSRNISGCYVCTELPISSNQPRLTSRPVPAPRDGCFIRNSVCGVSTSFYIVMGNTTFYICDVTEFKQFNVKTPVSNYVEILADSHFSHCIMGTGSIPVRTIPMHMCNMTYYYSLHQAGPGGKVHDLKGTYAIDGFHWMCETAIYLQLPPSWSGVCAPVYVTDHTYVISVQPSLNKSKRELIQDVRGSFFSWLTSGPWWQLLLKIMTPVIAVLLLFCLFTLCVIPCIRAMILRMVGGIFDTMLSQDYQLLDKNHNYGDIMEEKSLNLTIV